MAAIHHSLARANGWGSAGQCPAPAFAKTPAARESDAALRRPSGNADGDIFTDATAPLQTQLRLLQAEYAQLRDAARDYYVHSDLMTLHREGVEAADRLVRILGHAELVA